MNEKEIEVVEVLTGSYGIYYDYAVQIAKVTYGDMTKAKIAADMMNIQNASIESVIAAITLK
ncbi:hypothetical protein GK047_01330 [Paenibacillus sp. SYP-B3998]|uniref:Uncharacterized protein n=1 Tax=Paenibacillus sp. SYP-B3998 TaxID=2678564 RepID=A0A6G3ZSI1_9BACL|nr:hypothetical protein [Paenibacillus sp. SYP-B3998]NEW04664.1 hypothetical protein [Paenibacillus sp. SYP-B3998]